MRTPNRERDAFRRWRSAARRASAPGRTPRSAHPWVRSRFEPAAAPAGAESQTRAESLEGCRVLAQRLATVEGEHRDRAGRILDHRPAHDRSVLIGHQLRELHHLQWDFTHHTLPVRSKVR